MLNKRAQIGETITWIIATIIIIVTLMVFIYVSGSLAKIKMINLKDLNLDSDEEINWVEMKTSFAYDLNQDKKELIDYWIKEKENEK